MYLYKNYEHTMLSFYMTNINNYIIVVICGLICLCFFVYGICKLLKKRKIKKGIKNLIEGKETENNKVVRILDEYVSTYNEKEYTSEYASDYINIDSISSIYNLNLKLINIIPNILTSIGILGTFIGLALAVYGFDSETSDGIRESIKTLLSGMSTAFCTSIIGMFLSIIFLWREKCTINCISGLIEEFCTYLDKKHHCSIDEAVIKSFSFIGDNGEIYSPSETIQRVQEDVKKMRNQLETFGTDICDNIGNAMDASFQDKLVPIINELSAKLENPAQAVTDSLITELRNVCNDFNNNVTKDVNDRMEELLERFIDASNSILTIPDTINEVNHSLSESTKDTVIAVQAVSEALDNQTIRINDLSDLFVNSLTKLSDVTDTITDLHAKLETMPESISNASTAIIRSAEEINESHKDASDALEKIQSVNQDTAAIVGEYTDNIQSIQDGLSSIFAEITDGLSQYSEAVKQSLQGMLDPFTSSVTDATEKVANAITPLNDAVTELCSFGDSVKQLLSEVDNSFKPIETVLKQLSEIKQKAIEESENSNHR